MGHLYRSVNLANTLKKNGLDSIFYLNNHAPSLKVLRDHSIEYEVIDLDKLGTGLEATLIRRNAISLWINDRLDTDENHAKIVKNEHIPLVTFDDRGSGAEFSDLNVAALVFANTGALKGSRVLTGIRYLVLNEEIFENRRLRKSPNKIVVSLGGSDTYGVTIKVAKLLATHGLTATVIVGPAFEHLDELLNHVQSDFEIKMSVPSLIEEFSRYDLAVTGAGITPFEANAAGLPCIVVANEEFEISVGAELERLGGSKFAGHHHTIDPEAFNLKFDIEQMSCAGMERIDLKGCQRIKQELKGLIG